MPIDESDESGDTWRQKVIKRLEYRISNKSAIIINLKKRIRSLESIMRMDKLVNIDATTIETRVANMHQSNTNQQEKKTMSKRNLTQIVTERAVWIDGNSNERDIRNMEDAHIISCIALVQRKLDALNNTSYQCPTVDRVIAACNTSIELFVLELNNRDE